jgi:hypothetical protein
MPYIKCNDSTMVEVSYSDYAALKSTYPELQMFTICAGVCGSFIPVDTTCRCSEKAGEYLATLRTKMIYG